MPASSIFLGNAATTVTRGSHEQGLDLRASSGKSGQKYFWSILVHATSSSAAAFRRAATVPVTFRIGEGMVTL